MENESETANSHAVEQMRKDLEQKVIELTGRLKLKDEVISFFNSYLVRLVLLSSQFLLHLFQA